MTFDRKALEKLEQTRDEMKLQAHLLKADLKDEWAKLEKDWEKNQVHINHLKSSANQTAEDFKKAGQAGLHELKERYQDIKAKLEKRT